MPEGGADGRRAVLDAWREQTLRWLSSTAAIVGSPVFAYFLWVFLHRGEFLGVVFLALVWGGLLAQVLRGARWSQRLRAHSFLLLFLSLVAYLQLRAGPMGAVGTMNLAMVLLALLLRGWQAAVGYGVTALAVFAGAAAVWVNGWYLGLYEPRLDVGDPRESYTWIAIGLVLGVMGSLGLLSLKRLLDGLQSALQEQTDLTGALEVENAVRAKVIEELRETRARLEHAQKLELVGQLAGGMAHDLNNTLTVILAEADLCSDREAAVGIRSAALQAGQLTRQMLSFSRRDLVRARPLDLELALTPLLRALRRLLPASHTLQVRMGPSVDAVVRIDPVHLQQVLFNLVVNARDAMPDGGAITLAVRSWGKHAFLVVSDEGEGIAEDVLPTIFDPFFTTKSADHGTGLGLANVRGIVTRSGGEISVESTPGAGATFEVRLPLCSEPAEVVAVVTSGTPQLAGCTVMVVEGDVRVRASMTAVLLAAGVHVLEARSVSDAIAQLEDGAEPELVCSDAVVRGGGAEALLAWLDAHRGEVPMLLASDYSSSQALRAAVSDGRVRTVSKPFTGEELLEAVAESLHAVRLVAS